MFNTIYVPQGRSGRLTAESLQQGVLGAFVDDYSTCNILVAIGKNRISISHIDFSLHPTQLFEEINWVRQSGQCELLLISKEEGKDIKEQFLGILKGTSVKIKPITVEDKNGGLYVSFSSQKNSTIHPQIKKYAIGDKPEDLIHHPLEEQLIRVNKIEHIIGLKAKFLSGQTRLKSHLIFNGTNWSQIPQSECKVYDPDRELSDFSSSDSLSTIKDKLIRIMNRSKSAGIPVSGDAKKITEIVAPHLNAYLQTQGNYQASLTEKCCKYGFFALTVGMGAAYILSHALSEDNPLQPKM